MSCGAKWFLPHGKQRNKLLFPINRIVIMYISLKRYSRKISLMPQEFLMELDQKFIDVIILMLNQTRLLY